MSNTKTSAPDCGDRNEAHELALPFDLIEGNEHHGPYIVNSYGRDVCDFYTMSNPASLSVRNGGDSEPIWFTDAAENAAFMHRAANCHHELVAALKLVMTWIDNWSPDFIADEEWPEDEARISAALTKAEAPRV